MASIFFMDRSPLPQLFSLVAKTASIWVVNIPGLLGVNLGGTDGGPLAPTCLLVTGVIGTATIGLYWLTFFPPVWYRRRFNPAEA